MSSRATRERRAQLLESVRSVDGVLYEQIKGLNVFEYFVCSLESGLTELIYRQFQQTNNANHPVVLQIAAVLLSLLAVLAYFTAKSFRLLAAQRNALSVHTVSLYYTLLYLLLADIAAAALLEVVPQLTRLYATAVGYQYVNSAVLVAMSLSSLYPLVTNAALLFYVKPYRRAVLRLATSWLRGTESIGVERIVGMAAISVRPQTIA
jgi:Serpentine type 7TM GPCR chemoreceptor Srh